MTKPHAAQGRGQKRGVGQNADPNTRELRVKRARQLLQDPTCAERCSEGVRTLMAVASEQDRIAGEGSTSPYWFEVAEKLFIDLCRLGKRVYDSLLREFIQLVPSWRLREVASIILGGGSVKELYA